MQVFCWGPHISSKVVMALWHSHNSFKMLKLWISHNQNLDGPGSTFPISCLWQCYCKRCLNRYLLAIGAVEAPRPSVPNTWIEVLKEVDNLLGKAILCGLGDWRCSPMKRDRSQASNINYCKTLIFATIFLSLFYGVVGSYLQTMSHHSYFASSLYRVDTGRLAHIGGSYTPCLCETHVNANIKNLGITRCQSVIQRAAKIRT